VGDHVGIPGVVLFAELRLGNSLVPDVVPFAYLLNFFLSSNNGLVKLMMIVLRKYKRTPLIRIDKNLSNKLVRPRRLKLLLIIICLVVV
jgi:hypothetical protein